MATDEEMSWRVGLAAGRAASFGVGGCGRPVLFLHGWGLTGRTYEAPLRGLLRSNVRVSAPSMPGFGGTAPLSAAEMSLAGYAKWVAQFCLETGIHEPVTVIGHSFGGGVATQLAHDRPDLVSRLILVNSIGGSAWQDGRGAIRPMRERPLWDWGLQVRTEVRSGRQLTTTVPRIIREAVPNLLRSPGTLWRVATLARTADLAAELAELRRRKLPVGIAWSDQDNVLPQPAFAALCAALGAPECVTVSGGHGWLLDNPHLFADVMADMLAERPVAPREIVAA